MEMCYEGALVMPSSYAVMNEEEMTYVEGGNTIGYRCWLCILWNLCKCLWRIIGKSGYSTYKKYMEKL